MTVRNNISTVNNLEVFSFLNPKENDRLCDIKGKDLQNLFTLIDNFYLETRDVINIDKDITLGLEIECEDTDMEKIEKKIKDALPDTKWQVTSDSSLDKGAEIKSPILTDTKENWNQLETVCSILKPIARINNNSGGHIHVGAQILGNNTNSYKNFLKLWSTYENVLFKFAYGDFASHRPKILKHAAPVSNLFWDSANQITDDISIKDLLSLVNESRYHAINFKNIYDSSKFYVHNTIEFRCPNGSLKSAIWQNNINTFVKLLNYSKKDTFNTDLIDERHKGNINIYENLEFYDEIFIGQALELCDIIFDNNLDKIYFLRQYLKSFEIDNNYKVLDKQITRD